MPAKRSRPAFSPPQPKKSNPSASRVKKRASTGSATKVAKPTKSKSRPTKPPQRRSRYTSATESESDSQGGDDTADEDGEEDEEMQDDTNLSDDENEDQNEDEHDESSPEPDYILAEVTHESNASISSSDPPVPLPLMHRILHAHFAAPEKTKISKDAREVLGKYIDVFVREAIMRCAYEKTGNTTGAEKPHGDEDEDENDVGDGWLEVDDLEKVAVQLCLDF